MAKIRRNSVRQSVHGFPIPVSRRKGPAEKSYSSTRQSQEIHRKVHLHPPPLAPRACPAPSRRNPVAPTTLSRALHVMRVFSCRRLCSLALQNKLNNPFRQLHHSVLPSSFACGFELRLKLPVAHTLWRNLAQASKNVFLHARNPRLLTRSLFWA